MKCLFLIKDYDNNQVIEYLLINDEDVEKVYSIISEYDALDWEEKDKYDGGTVGALEYLKQKDIEFETLTCGGAYRY